MDNVIEVYLFIFFSYGILKHVKMMGISLEICFISIWEKYFFKYKFSKKRKKKEKRFLIWYDKYLKLLKFEFKRKFRKKLRKIVVK